MSADARPSVLKNDHSSLTVRGVYKLFKPTFLHKYNMNCYRNELSWLQHLSHTDVVPHILHADEATSAIVTEYVGEPVTAQTLPENWKAQRDHILKTLLSNNCRHNDIKPTEILVQAGRLRLVDFGWASRVDRPIPSNFPDCLGGKWRCPHGLCDKYSFDKAIADILQTKTPDH